MQTRPPLRLLLAALALAFIACTGCRRPADPVAAKPPPLPAIPPPETGNSREPNPLEWQPDHDYFPDKSELTYAQAFKISYHGHYKLVTINRPWRDSTKEFQYLLVQRGTPQPDGFPGVPVIEVPVRTLVTLANPFLPHVDMLDVEDALVGHSMLPWVTTPAIRARIEAGAVTELGTTEKLNAETLIRMHPDLIMANAIGEGGSDVHNRLQTLGLPVVVNADYMETTPLGRAEWLKFMAAFFNAEAVANGQFTQIAADYEALKARAAGETEKPSVLVGAPFRGTWYVPGGQSNVANLVADVGGAYVWADDPSSGSQILEVEAVILRARKADYWINTGIWTTRAEALAEDSRYQYQEAMRKGHVYNHVKTQQPNGANDYWEGAMARPDLLLHDLVKILHPHLLPDHTLIWYKNLDD